MPDLISPPPNTFYAVMRIATGELLYLGKSEHRACVALNPGCCYGTAKNEVIAQRRCIEWHGFFAKRQGVKRNADSTD